MSCILQNISEFILAVGFPIFVCLYLFIRFERLLISLDRSIQSLVLLVRIRTESSPDAPPLFTREPKH